MESRRRTNFSPNQGNLCNAFLKGYAAKKGPSQKGRKTFTEKKEKEDD